MLASAGNAIYQPRYVIRQLATYTTAMVVMAVMAAA